MQKTILYISLFSGAGIGCYGFLQEGFECVATVENIKKRLDIQKINNKCKYETGYICENLNKIETLELIKKEWNNHYNGKEIDIIIATPPCQGMSVVNQKKNNELNRNSLVVSAIKIISDIKPKIFIFENVRNFLKTKCTSLDNSLKSIQEEIFNQLGVEYLISYKVLNLKNYGSNSSRTRTLVIGVLKKYENIIAPFELFPDYIQEKTLHSVISKYPSLSYGEISKDNPLHFSKIFQKRMIPWINDLKEGESAMNSVDKLKRPHKIVDGEIIYYKKGFGDKYKRQYWHKVAQCIHTANGCLSSQNTIHPKDNRVFSIAELMDLMSIPESFKWSEKNIFTMNSNDIKQWLSKNENNIRICIGEAVPTKVFRNIAKKIKQINCKNIFDFNK